MSDFFMRLAERTLGMEPVARPDLAPMVSSAAKKESAPFVALENTASASNAGPEESKSPSFDWPIDSLPMQPEIRPVSRRERADLDDRTLRSVTQDAVGEGQPRPQALASLEKHDVSFAAGETSARAVRAEKNSQAVEFTRPVRYETVIAAPMSERVRQSEAPSLERFPAALPPTIHVSIGRIDVRATTPAPARAKASERRPARLSLEQYLRERNEGRR